MAKPVLFGGLALIGAAVFVLVSNLFHTIEKNSVKGAEDTSMQAAAADVNLAPIGSVNAVDKTIVKAARTGEQVFTAVCTSCHTAGVLGAPKVDDKAAWTPRAAQGLDVLINHAVNGIRSMPAHGGDPTTTEEELSNAIVYMTGKAGIDLSSQVKAAPAAAADTKPADAAAAPAPAAAPATEQAAAPAPTAEAKPAEPAPAPVAVPATEQAAAPAPTAEAKPAEPAPAAIDGEKVYKSTCFACHDVGIAGSPKLGDKADWGPRVAKGSDALYQSAINGRMNITPGKVMPAKGGNSALSDAEVKAAVDYMMSKAK
jgi:cytochrome c5